MGNNSKEFSTNFIQTGEKEYNVGEVEEGRGGEGGGVVPKLPVEGKGAWYHPREAGYVLK